MSRSGPRRARACDAWRSCAEATVGSRAPHRAIARDGGGRTPDFRALGGGPPSAEGKLVRDLLGLGVVRLLLACRVLDLLGARVVADELLGVRARLVVRTL